jgi:hypothetical protein
LHSQRAVLDFSLETRLAKHFSRFGPFIAVGSPKESLPQPGAARIFLPHDQWQDRILAWMQEAELIVMYAGRTQSVNWELRKKDEPPPLGYLSAHVQLQENKINECCRQSSTTFLLPGCAVENQAELFDANAMARCWS